MSNRIRSCRWLAASIVLLAGCGDEAPPFEFAPVTGKVTYEDGSPLQGKYQIINFTPVGIKPVDGQYAPPASAKIEPDGTFKLASGQEDGAVVGQHKITLVVFDEYGPSPKSMISKEYNDLSSTPLARDVKSGSNEFNDLKVKR